MFMRMSVLMGVRMHRPVGMSVLMRMNVNMHMRMRMIVLDWAGHDGFLPRRAKREFSNPGLVDDHLTANTSVPHALLYAGRQQGVKRSLEYDDQ